AERFDSLLDAANLALLPRAAGVSWRASYRRDQASRVAVEQILRWSGDPLKAELARELERSVGEIEHPETDLDAAFRGQRRRHSRSCQGFDDSAAAEFRRHIRGVQSM